MSTATRTAAASNYQAPESWQLSHHPDPDSDGWECLLYSDAYLNAPYGQHEVGQFLFWATHAEPPLGAVAPRLVLRIPHAHPILEWQEGGKQAGPSLQVLRRNSRWWLGMSADDEVAALLNLALGVRLRSGGLVRRFVHGGDPAGVAGVDYSIRAFQAARSYSCRVPPRRSRLRTSRCTIRAFSLIGSGVWRSGAAWPRARGGR